MTKPILLVTRRLPPAIEARAARDYDARLSADDAPVTGADILARADGAAAVLCCPAEKLDAATIAALPDTVKVIGTFSVGFDHIDMAAAKARGIPVVNTPDVLSVATAECAMLLILASGRRLGIFGMGRIGRELARMARGFGMEVHYRDQQRLPAEMEQGATYHGDDDSFLAVCDVLSLHAPGGEGTRHWLDAGRIAKLPRGAVVANAARGTLIDDGALVAALQSGQVAAAGLDVYNNEPRVDQRYLGLENVVLLPHLGSATTETRDAMGQIVLDGIDAVLAGRRPSNLAG